MPTLNQLRGLRASDRTEEEQRAINQQMGYKEEPETIETAPVKPMQTVMPTDEQESESDTASAAMINQAMKYKKHLDEQYEQALAEREEAYGLGRSTVNTNANDYIDKVASEVSSYYKKFKGTDKLPLNDNEKKELAAAYDARKQTYGEQNADVWLDNYMKDKVGQNQSWFEQATHAISHLVPAIEGGLIQTYGMLHGALAHIAGAEGYNENPDLNWWDSFINDVIDNPVTRYGRDIEMSGASHISDALNVIGLSDQTANEKIAAMKETATKYNPEGIGEDAIVTTNEQDETVFNATTPWQALQSGGFTALSMLTGAAEARAAGWLFGKLAQGANWLNKTNKIIKTEKGLEKTLEGLKKVQNFTDLTIIPGTVGSVEGAMEGLNTKIEVEREAVDKLDEYYKDKVSKEAEALYNSEELNPMMEIDTDQGKILTRKYTPDEAFQEVWNKYQNEYTDSRRQIDWASSKAGIHNFYANSLINGMMNTTLKAGLMAPRVQETLRNSKMFGWAYKNPKFNIAEDGVTVTPKMSKAGIVGRVLKEPLGEGLEEYEQSLSSDIFSSAAENNIDEFIKARFEPDATVKVGDSFGSDYAAALTALKESLTNKESIQSAILGAVSSTMGTVGGIGRGYHRDEKGNLVQNSLFDARNFKRGLNSEGEQESWTDYARRVTPWRSGAINAYFDRREEMADAEETAANLTEWLKDSQNKAKWDGLVGTANWMTQMENAAESNDQFSYRKAQMGKAINDIFMLSKLKGTNYYDAMIADLQKAASGEVSQEEIEKIKANGGEDYQGINDEEVVEKIQSNANHMLGLMTRVEDESKSLDRLLGRADEDTKQSLIFGKIMEENFQERKEQLQEEIDTITGRINSSRSRSHTVLDDDLKSLILEYGTLNKALKAQEEMQAQQEKLQQKIEDLEAIDPSKTSDKQKEELIKSKAELKKVDKRLEGFKGLYDEEGQVDSSLAQLVLNEEEIMNLDPVTRAMVLAQGANRLYNATHQNRQKVNQLNLELDEVQHQIDALEAQKQKWTKPDGGVKKGHNKQYERNTKKIEELTKQKEAKMRALDAEQGRMDTKPVYNSAQQEVIDNLVQQGVAQDRDFLDKVVDMGRLEKGIKDYHQQYQAILSDPRAYQNYVKRARYNAQRDLTRRRAERIAGIQNYQEYSQELDRLTANTSEPEYYEIMQTLRAENDRQKRAYQKDNMVVDENTGELVAPTDQPQTNYDRYTENNRKQLDLIRQFAKNPNLTDNDQSMLINAMQYLSSQGVDMDDREAAVQTLIEKDEEGNIGGKFRQYVEAKNDMMPTQQRAFMPQFTSIGQIVGDYVDLINGANEDAVNRGNANPTVTVDTSAAGVIDTSSPAPATVVSSPSPSAPAPEPAANNQSTQPATTSAGPSLFDIGGSTPEAGQFTDNNGTVATDTQLNTTRQRQTQQQQQTVEKSARQQAFEQISTPEVAQDVETSSNVISNSNETDEVKELASQYLDDIAVNGNERLETIDDVMTAIQEQAEKIQNMADSVEDAKEKDKYKQAAGLLQKVYASLNAKKLRGGGRRRVAPMPSSRPQEPKSNTIHTANIFSIQEHNPDAWPVQFTDDHEIEKATLDLYEGGAITKDTPVYFITDSEWAAITTQQMTPTKEMLSINPKAKGYNTLNNMPVVAAVKVDPPQDSQKTTAIEVNGEWYQPIGVLPSSNANTQGAENTRSIRKLAANREQGRHLVTENGLPDGAPLTSRVHGVNYLRAHYPGTESTELRDNSSENNTDVIESILDDYLPKASADRLRAMPKEQMLEDDEYKDARNKFLNHLGWGINKKYPDNLAVAPRGNKVGEVGSPMLIFRKPMSETEGRTNDKKLPEVLKSGTGEEVRSFNSRTQRLYDEVIRPIYQFLQNKDWYGDKSALVITQEDLAANPKIYREEAERLTKILNGYGDKMHGVSDFIYINPKSGWKLQVTAPEALQVAGDDTNTSQTIYKVFYVNQDPAIPHIEIGTIRAGKQDTDAAFELLRNIMYDANTGNIRDFLMWQLPASDAQNINNPKESKARQNYAAIVDDGILEYPGETLSNNVDYVEISAPISQEGRILYPSDKITNPANAQPSSPQNVTPQGNGAIVTGNGQIVEPDSGANLGSTGPTTPPSGPQKSEKLKQAEKIVEKIKADSQRFELVGDTHYTDGEKDYLRVTTVIGADETAPQWIPEISDILDKLKGRHAIDDAAYKDTYVDTQDMSKKLGIPVAEIKRAVAELRTTHKHEGYGAWSTPSTSIGNTFDTITRDFLAGHLKDKYPNVNKEVMDTFVHQLELFKADCDGQGIHLVSEGVMAHGTITMTDEDGNTHDVNVAGTLDLFGYDDDGNFYIFDMKTTRKHTDKKLEDEKDKWSRQISMYADLLKQSYPGFTITSDRLRIIPINISYPTPMGKSSEWLDPSGPQYSEITEGERKGQLQMQYRRQSEPQDFIMEMPKNPKESNGDNAVGMRKTNWREQFKPGYRPFSINWDNLSSEDQDIADGLLTQTNDANHSAESAPQKAHIETPVRRRPGFLPNDAVMDEDTDTGNIVPPPIVPIGSKPIVPSWDNLTDAQKQILESVYGVDNMDDYNESINDPATAEMIAQDLGCKSVM